MQWINRAFEQSAYEWNLSSNTAWWLFWLPILGSVLVIFSAVNRDLYRFLLTEDGPVEWLTFVGFVIAAVIGGRICIVLFRTPQLWLAGIYAFFTAAMVFCAGEEISWGQRIFNYEIPDMLRTLNPSNELALHNVGGTYGFFNLAVIIVEFAGVSAYLVSRRLHLEKRWTYAHYLLMPPLCLSSYFLIALVYNPIRFVFGPEPNSVVGRYAEWTEMCLALGLCAFAGLTLRLLREKTMNNRMGVTMWLRNSE